MSSYGGVVIRNIHIEEAESLPKIVGVAFDPFFYRNFKDHIEIGREKRSLKNG